MLRKHSNASVLVIILLVAAFLRLYRFDLADVINDEVFYGFRAIGLIDFLNTPHQTTPYEWYETLPTWARFSFHDHPPLGFYIQHVFFRIFGENVLAMRLPFMLAGVASVYLTYLIGRRLVSSEPMALLSAGILAVNNYHVWVSRIGMQESLVIFFMLLAIYCFLRMINVAEGFSLPPGNLKVSATFWLYSTALVTGLAILMKYTAVILLPIFAVWLIWNRRDLLSVRRIVFSAVILLIITSPIIIYNIGLYQARGHFDFQLSFLLKQNVPEWQLRPGREVGGLIAKFQNFGSRFGQGYGIIFSLVASLGFINLLRHAFRKNPDYQLLLLIIGFLLLLFLIIGPQERFLAMLAPFLAITIAVPPLIKGRLGGVLLTVFLLLELALTTNSYLLANPQGSPGKHYSILRYDHNNWGYRELEQHLQKYYQGSYPAQVFELKFPFARQLQKEALAKARAAGKQPSSILFVTDTSMHGLAGIWYFARYALYHGWPMINSQSYVEIVTKQPNFFRDQGFLTTVFVKTGDTLARRDDQGIEATLLEQNLQTQGIQPTIIHRASGAAAFRVYEF